jgi:hypothetical protein
MIEFNAANATDDEIHQYALDGGDAGPVLAAGRAHIATPSPTMAGPTTTREVPMIVKTLRMPTGMVMDLEATNHPDGLSGAIREAVAEWLDRHTGAVSEVSEIRHALAVLSRHAAKLEDVA